MPVEGQDNRAHPAHRANLDVQEIQDKDHRDRLDPQVLQVMEDQDRKETRETQALPPALELSKLDHRDHRGLLGLKDQQVLSDQEVTKVNRARRACRVPPEDQEAPREECRLTEEETVSLDRRVHREILDFLAHKVLKGTLGPLGVLALQEAPSQSPRALPAPRVLLVLQACPAPTLHPVRCINTSTTI